MGRERIHIIENQNALIPLGASSKMNAEWAFLTHLRDLGRYTATEWLEVHFDDVGLRSTVDLRRASRQISPLREEGVVTTPSAICPVHTASNF